MTTKYHTRSPIEYHGFTIEQERDGSFSVFHYAYHYLANRKTVEECKRYIDSKL